MKLYEITDDVKAVYDLFQSAVDDEGNPRPLTEDEEKYLQECFNVSKDDFEKKFDSYGKFMANLKLEADNAEAERKNFKAEMDRLSSRAKAYENRRERVKAYLFYAMQNIGIDKFKSSLFSANVQSSPLSVEVVDSSTVKAIPDKFLKPREVNLVAVKEGIKNGTIIVTDSGKLFYEGEVMPGLMAKRNKILVIR